MTASSCRRSKTTEIKKKKKLKWAKLKKVNNTLEKQWHTKISSCLKFSLLVNLWLQSALPITPNFTPIQLIYSHQYSHLKVLDQGNRCLLFVLQLIQSTMNHKLQCWIFALLFVASIFTKSESFSGRGGVFRNGKRNTKLQVRKISPIKPLLNLKPLLLYLLNILIF